jgi:ribonuclease G
MSKELFVSSTPHETKVAIVEDDQLTEVYFERENEYTLAGSIYKGRVTRVLPGMQSAFVNIGLERDAFLYVSDFLLEEEEDAEVLDQVRMSGPPEPNEAAARAETPIEAENLLPPAEKAEIETAAPSPAGDREEEPDREGARKWRGRRRRRGRDRFHEREDRGDREQQREQRPAEAASEEQKHTPLPPQPQPMVLPGESISKYQPNAPKPASTQTEVAPVPQYRVKPSTEYSLDSMQFSPESMVLPGESLSKYRDRQPSGRTESSVEVEPQSQTAPPVSHESESSTQQQVESDERQHDQKEIALFEQTGHPVERANRAIEEQEETKSEAYHRSTPEIAPFRESFRSPEIAAELNEEQEDRRDEERLDEMNVASVFGGEAVETPEEGKETSERAPEVKNEADPGTEERSSWYRSGRGVVEEEEIEEEELDLPGFNEERFDLSDYEELEEQELAPADDQMLVGNELTEAVRDAHVDEHATGRYEAEALETHEEEEEADGQSMFDDEGPEENGHELELAEEATEELEGTHAEASASGATAGYQQRPERRSSDRRNRRLGRRMRGRPRFHVQRQLPAISDLLKEGQEILVQIAKEPIAKKGARITSHIALPGRFLVYMPTVHHTGVSRKIASDEERQRLKRIVLSERGEAHGGFIVRTAASGANEDDLRADIRFLINLWNEIRGRADKSKAPALIYHDLNLVERILRDQVTVSFSSIWVDTEQEYERILRFVSRFQSSLVKRVKLYTKETPLFEQFNISDEINKALKSKVWLKSGGYIVINQTEALVAIDVNTGKYVGKTARLEDTIVKTNIDAIREIVRQIRLRDLGGIIVIDFIDMDERKNRHRVMQALEEALKADRAPSKVLQFNDFGLVAITRKRVKQSLERTLGQQCPTCTGTGMIKSVRTTCNEIYVEMRKMARHFDHDVMLRVHPDVAKALKANNARWLQEMEELTKNTILVKPDALLHPEQFDIQ